MKEAITLIFFFYEINEGSKVYMSNLSQMLHFLIIFWKGNLYLFVCHIFLSCGLYFLCFENVANMSYQTLSLKPDEKKIHYFVL